MSQEEGDPQALAAIAEAKNDEASFWDEQAQADCDPLASGPCGLFAAKMSLPGEENKQVPPLEQLPDANKAAEKF